MVLRKPSVLFVLIYLLLFFMMQACAMPVSLKSVDPTKAVTPSVALSQATMPTATPALLSPTMSLTPTPTPSATPIVFSTFPPDPSGQYITNIDTASDGTYIYYFTSTGVNRMKLDDSDVRKTGIGSGRHQLLAITSGGLYYTAVDNNYTPSEAESYAYQSFLSLNLVFYNTKTGKNRILRKHIVDAIEYEGSIYMIDAGGHYRITRYDIAKGSVSNVTGKFEGADFPYGLSFIEEGDKLYIYYTNMNSGDENSVDQEYLMTGNAFQLDNDSFEPQNNATDQNANSDLYAQSYYDAGNGVKFRVDNSSGAIAVWTGNNFTDSGIENIGAIFVIKNRLIVCTVLNYSGSTDNLASVSLYEIVSNGQVKEMLRKPDLITDSMGINIEVINGWIFAFCGEEVPDADSSMLFKYKVS
jgi:hypothetical protein